MFSPSTTPLPHRGLSLETLHGRLNALEIAFREIESNKDAHNRALTQVFEPSTTLDPRQVYLALRHPRDWQECGVRWSEIAAETDGPFFAQHQSVVRVAQEAFKAGVSSEIARREAKMEAGDAPSVVALRKIVALVKRIEVNACGNAHTSAIKVMAEEALNQVDMDERVEAELVAQEEGFDMIALTEESIAAREQAAYQRGFEAARYAAANTARKVLGRESDWGDCAVRAIHALEPTEDAGALPIEEAPRA